MSFLSPLFLAGAAAAAVPLLLHLLKREPEPRVRFTAVKLLRNAPVEHTQSRRLRELLLLALRMATLVLLALAFARPFFATGSAVGSSGVTVIALDTSYSMSAPGRFERARQLAKDAIARAPSGDLVGVLTFADRADIALRPTADRVLAASAIDEATAGFGATRYRAALSAASQMLAAHRGAIVVVTDLQENGWDAGDRAPVAESTAIRIADVGPLDADLAVTAVRADADRVVATIRNAGARAEQAHVHLLADDRAVSDTTAALGPHATADVALPLAGHPATVAVAVDDRAGLQANNARYAVLGGTTRPAVLLVTGAGEPGRDAFYLQTALEAAAPAATAYEAAGVSAAQLGTWNDARLAGFAAVALLSTRGLERRGRELLAGYVKGGGGLLIAAGADVDGEVIGDVLGGETLKIVAPPDPAPSARALAPADVRHPIFERFGANAGTLGLVRFTRVSRVSGASCQTVARFTSGEAALIDCAAGEGRALVLASDLNGAWNDFPLHATFVPFVHESVRYLSAGRARSGDYVIGELPDGVAQRPGIATLADTAGRPRRVAVNVDPRESDPSRMSAQEFESAVTRLKDAGAAEARIEARQAEEHQHLWTYALGLMLLTLVAEGLVASRTA